MDSALQARPFPSCTTAELHSAVAGGRGSAAMVAEIERREAVDAGDFDKATPAERLRAIRAGKL